MRAVTYLSCLLLAGAALPAAARAASCNPADDTLCLSLNRFQVEADWRTPDGEEGRGHAVQLTSDTGTFWFFHPSNLEMVVKVLDACADPYHHFWVFAGGLTNVEVRLRVTDTATGAVRTYDNPMGREYAPITDTAAFDTCGTGATTTPAAPPTTPTVVPASTPAAHPALGGNVLAGGPSDLPELTVADLPTAETATGEATLGGMPTTMRLGRWGRFVVSLDWQGPNGEHGPAGAVQLSPDSGFLWFFSPQNVEVAVKVLDACDQHDTFWIFVSGMTNLGVRLTVRDDLTEEVKVYTSPVGEAFVPISDTAGLAVCP